MTSLAEEQAEQARWTARLHRPTSVYDRLVETEFEAPDAADARVVKALGHMLGFAAQQVPYYRASVSAAELPRDAVSALGFFPVLSKLDVQDAGAALLAAKLPAGVEAANWTASSGTTGRPTRVLHSVASMRMFAVLKQREYRWFRLRPAGKFASMRLPGHLPRTADGAEIPRRETVRRAAWQYLENFATGPFIGISLTTPVDDRIAWLRTERPDYLMSLSESLEMLAMACGDSRPSDSLKGIVSISEQLTPGMRTYVEARFGAPAHQNYGLNEIGIVGARCEAGRYHVHTEHCIAEIVDNAGRACAVGQSGRIVVTALNNPVMPLIRYDTGDLAEAVAGPCACGRTLPSFGEIVGRYSRVAFLPSGTPYQMVTLREVIETMPLDLTRDLREFQIHQYKDKRMELRIVARAELPEALYARLREAWSKAAGENSAPLAFVRVNEIPRSRGGKAEVFTSDFMPKRDERV